MNIRGLDESTLIRRNQPSSPPSDRLVHALTFDVEDWYQGFVYRNIHGWEKYASREMLNVEKILDLLAASNVTATFFVLGKFAEAHADVVKLIASQGHEIATHGYSHTPIPSLTQREFRVDLRRSIDLLESLTARKVLGHRAASWSLTKECQWALAIMQEEGLVYDSSIFPTGLHKFGWPGASRDARILGAPEGKGIAEFPAQVLSLGPLRIPAAGGFYLRAMPLFISRWALGQSRRRGQAGMVYLHPYDLDAEVPVLRTGPVFKIIRYYHLSKTKSYLVSLLQEFQFGAVRDILASIRA